MSRINQFFLAVEVAMPDRVGNGNGYPTCGRGEFGTPDRGGTGGTTVCWGQAERSRSRKQ
ncbi:MAG: hypothetical protein SVX43_08660 [Cyanobacteriota bacterium]|nr:hypothetical protein [Cyanobacteriota bacterium]